MKHQPPCVDWAVKLSLRQEDLSSADREALCEHVKTCNACAQAQADYLFLKARLSSLSAPNITLFPRLSLSLWEDQKERELVEDKQYDTIQQAKAPSFTPRQSTSNHYFFHKKVAGMASILAVIWLLSAYSLLTEARHSQTHITPGNVATAASGIALATPTPIISPPAAGVPMQPISRPTFTVPPLLVPTFTNCVSNDAMFGSNTCHTHVYLNEQKISAANVAGLILAWKQPFRTTNVIGAAPVVANGIVYIGAIDGIMYAIDAKTGTLKWQKTIGGQIWSTAVVVHGVVYVGSTNGDVDALDAVSGHLIWQSPNLGVIESSPTVVNGIVYIGSFNDSLYALDATTGQPIWAFSTGGSIFSSPAARGNVVYIGSFDGNVYAIDATTGKKIWSYYAGKSVYSSPALDNNTVYVGTAGGNAGGDVVAINVSTGLLLWQHHVSGQILSSPAIANGMLYIGSFDYNLYAFDALTGQLKWTGPTRSYIWTASPTIANGVVYIGSMDAHLYAFDAVSGQLLKDFPLFNSIYGSPAIANGMLFIGSASHLLYAFRLPD